MSLIIYGSHYFLLRLLVAPVRSAENPQISVDVKNSHVTVTFTLPYNHLSSRWPGHASVADWSGLSTYGLKAQCLSKKDEHLAYTPLAIEIVRSRLALVFKNLIT